MYIKDSKIIKVEKNDIRNGVVVFDFPLDNFSLKEYGSLINEIIFNFKVDKNTISQIARYARNVNTIMINKGNEGGVNYSLIRELEKVFIQDGVEEVTSMSFSSCTNLKYVSFPNSLKKINYSAFSDCENLFAVDFKDGIEIIDNDAFRGCNSLKKIILPNSIIKLGEGVFKNCIELKQIKLSEKLVKIPLDFVNGCLNLETIRIPDSTDYIEDFAFSECDNLRQISLNNGLERIGNQAFNGCKKLHKIKLPDTIEEIGNSCFFNSGLEEITIPDNVKVIKDSCFSNCLNLKRVKLSKKLKIISIAAFSNCKSLEEIEIPKTVIKIANNAFQNCGLKEIFIPNSVEILGAECFKACIKLKKVDLSESRIIDIPSKAFSFCLGLEEVKLNKQIESIYNKAFEVCNLLKEITLPDNVNYIGEEVFSCSGIEKIVIPDNVEIIKSATFNMSGLKEIRLSKNLKTIENKAFSFCVNLDKIDFPINLETIKESAFLSCNKIEKLEFPKSLKLIENNAFEKLENCNEVTIYSLCSVDKQLKFDNFRLNLINQVTNEKIVFDKIDGENFIMCDEGVLLYHDNNYCFFDVNNKFVQIPEKLFLMFRDKHGINPSCFIRLYEWIKKRKFIPHHGVVENLPINEINNFFVNNNDKKWRELITLSNIKKDEDKIAFFKLCYVVGVFSEFGKISDRGFNFIKERIIPSFDIDLYHVKFGGFDIYSNGYNDEYAKLMFKYYKDEHFLQESDDYDMEIDYTCNVYNNFNKVKNAYPNKIVNTNNENSKLTPSMAILAIHGKEYENINEGNENLALYIGKYGYSQQEFEEIQKLFNIGKNIKIEDMLLHAKKDDNSEFIYYELLEKNDPLGAILGDITNCCQTINKAGKSCLEYGLKEANSKFMVFKNGNKIIGQSWVWYDQISKRICLDNIEIPPLFKNKMKEDSIYSKEFIKCLKRCVNGFIGEMSKRGYEVNSITIGQGYNDLKDYLNEFKLVENQSRLNNYKGYSDALNQYVLYSNTFKR